MQYLIFKFFVVLPLYILIRCCCCDKKKPQVAAPASGATCVVNYRSKVRLGASVISQELGFVSEGEVVTLIETKITKNGNQRAQIRSQSLTGWINTVHKGSGQPTLSQAVVKEAPNPTYNPAPMAPAPKMAATEMTTPVAAPTYNPAPMAPAPTMAASAPLPAATAPLAASPASLHSVLAALGLGAYEPAMQAAGAVEAADLADLDEADMKEMGTYSAKYFS